MTKAEILLKPCPWCKKTPHVDLPIDNDWDSKNEKILGKESWIWEIGCKNQLFDGKRSCSVTSFTRVTIRKSQKTTLSKLLAKLNLLAAQWNNTNPEKAYENIIVSLDKIKFEKV